MNLAYAINVEVPLTDTMLLMQAYRMKDTDSIFIFSRISEDEKWEFGHVVTKPWDMDDATAFGYVEAFLKGSLTHQEYNRIFMR